MNERTARRAVIYCRVSTKEQVDEGGSLATQERLCKDYALKNGYEVAETFVEQGESAKNANRTELKRLIDYCTNRRNKIAAVIAYKIDRVARNIDDYRYIRVLLKKYGVEIKSTSEYFENTPAGRFMENIIANVAQFDNDVRTERSIGGMRDAMREGRYVWIAPFGYSNMKVAGKSTIVPDKNADLMRMLFEEVAKNKSSVDELRKRLRPFGLTTKKGKLLTKSHTYRLLKNEAYVGWIIKFGERHKGLYQPLISQELFDQVQRVLKRRSHRGFTYQRENPDFPLRRFVHHVSGKKVTGHWSQGRKNKYAYYRFIGIPASGIPSKKLENAYASFLNRYSIDPDLMQEFKRSLSEALSAAIESDVTTAKTLRAYINELNEKQTSLIDKNEKGVISDVVLRQQLELIEEKLTKAHADLLELSDQEENLDELFDFAAEYLINPGAVWKAAPFKQKVELQWFEFPKGITLNQGKFETAEISSIFKVKSIFLPLLSLKVPSRGQHYEQSRASKSPLKYTPLATLQQYVKEIKRLAEILKSIPP